jgi:hypothetical protein
VQGARLFCFALALQLHTALMSDDSTVNGPNLPLSKATLEAVMDLGVSNPHVLSYGNCSQTLPV